MEAMFFAVDKINRDENILANLSLGAEIRDTCSDTSRALEESLNFILRFQRQTNVSCKYASRDEILIGVNGAASSTVSIQVANFLRLFQVSQVSYASTSTTLSDKARFDYFMRTVPPDTLQARTLVDIVKHFNWTSVFTVHSEGSYGEKGMKAFEELAMEERICVVSSKEVNKKTTSKEYEEIVREFLEYNTTRVVVLFCDNENSRKMLAAVKQVIQKQYFTWVASDTWGTRTAPVKDYEAIADGAITVTLKLTKVNDFEQYFRKLTPQTNSRNPWFGNFLQEMGCSNASGCTNIKTLDDKVPFVIDAVYAFAHALDKLYREKCPEQKGVCKEMWPFPREKFHTFLENISFEGETGTVEFDQNGDSAGKYDIMVYDSETGRYERIGKWENNLTISLSELSRPYNPVTSMCGVSCQLGERKSFKDKCCWTCESCSNTQFIQDNKCVDCALGDRPNSNFSGCEPRPRTGLGKSIIISLSCIASLGIATTFIVTILFIVNYNKSLVRASGRDIMFLLLLGISFCYVLTILLVSLPVTVTACYVQKFFLGLPLTLCYAAILVKTCRVSRIFNRGHFTPLCITQGSQRVLLLGFFTVQVVISLANIYTKKPELIQSYTSSEVLLLCNFSHRDVISSLGIYNFLLVVLCTYFAFKTRQTPANFNEASFIGSAMYLTCAIWVILYVVYIVLDENIKAQTILISLNPLISATTLLGCIFGSKVYNLLSKREENSPGRRRVRKLTNETSTEIQDLGNDSGPATICSASPSTTRLFQNGGNSSSAYYNPVAEMDSNLV